MVEEHRESPLEALERSDADLLDLVRNAANIIGVDLSIPVQPTPTTVAIEAVSTNTRYTFKEQWILRWLIRRFLATNTKMDATEADVAKAHLLNAAPWKLLLYLMRTIPPHALTDLLVERKFGSHINSAISNYLKARAQTVAGNETTDDDAGRGFEIERPSKRRRLSPSPLHRHVLDGLDDVVLQLCVLSTRLATSNGVNGRQSSTSLWSSFDAYASFTSDSLRLAQSMLSNDDQLRSTALSISRLLSPWDSWQSAGGTSSSTDAETFNKTCLYVCLDIGEILSRENSAASKEAKHAIDARVAKSTILPLRQRFFKKHNKQWRAQGGCLKWAHIEPFAKDVSDHLSTSSAHDIAPWADYLFEIAMRLIPNYDTRTKQQEQAWVDELLLGLAYFACPGLERLTFEHTSVKIVDAIKDRELLNHCLTLTKLVKLAASAPCTPSLEVTSYLAGAISAWPVFEDPWAAMAFLMDVNSETMMPSAQLPTSNFALTQLISRIGEPRCLVNIEEYEILRDDIIIRVLRSFSASRALHDFVSLWKPQLQEAIRIGQPISDSRFTGVTFPAVSVWDDGDVFEEFKRQVSMMTSTVTLDPLFAELLPALSDLSVKGGMLLDCFAALAINVALIEASPHLITKETSQQTTDILEATARAMQRRTDYNGKRWRLWRFVLAVQAAESGLHLPGTLIDGDSQQASLIDGGKDLLDDGVWNQECFLRFQVLAKEARSRNKLYQAAFKDELHHLQTLIERLMITEFPNLHPNGTAWNGRVLTISTPQQLASACLGVLLANNGLLGRETDFSDALFQMSIDKVGREPTLKIDPMWVFLTMVQETAQLSLDRSEADLSSRLSKMLHEWSNSSIGTDFAFLANLNRLAMSRLRPAQLKSVAEKQFELLKGVKCEQYRPSDVAEVMAFLVWVGKSTSTSYARADAWLSWKEISNGLANLKIGAEAFDFLAVSRSMQEAVNFIFQHAMQADSNAKTAVDSVVKSTLKVIRSINKPSAKDDLTNHLFELYAAQSAVTNSHELGLSEEAISTVQHSLTTDILRATRDAVGARFENDESVTRAVILVDVATKLAPVLSRSAGLTRALSSLTPFPVSAGGEITLTDARSLHLQWLLQNHALRLSSLLASASTERSLDGNPTLGCEPTGMLEDDSWADYSKLAGRAVSFVTELREQDYARCLELCLERTGTDHGVVDQFVIGAIINRLKDNQLEMNAELSLLVNKVASCPYDNHAFSEIAELKLENVNLALGRLPRRITQATIDRLLANLCTFGSAGMVGGLPSTIEPQLLVDRICTIIGTLLSRFRRRLSDRHHLLLPVLQQVLRCFFYSQEVERRARQTAIIGSNPESLLRSLPVWIKGSHSALPASSATNLTRILSSICNPTVSAARSSRRGGKDSQLNDETRRVKALAGQHMQYLIMEYCRCTLDGEIQPAVKEKLLPGMYAVLDSMSRDLMRSLNANMDPSSRAIFKALYDDWVKYGKWDKS